MSTSLFRYSFLTLLLLFAGSAEAQWTGSGVKQRFATLDDLRVSYIDKGKGDVAIVLVHGWNCDAQVWKQQVAALAKNARVLAVDLPGHGESDKPQMQYNMDLHARALDAVLQDARVNSAILIGHSNGTPVVRQFYRKFRDKTRALIIVDGALRPFGDANFMERFIAPLRGRDYEVTAGRFINGMTAPMKLEAQRDEVRAMMKRGAQHVAVSEMESLRDPALWEEDTIEVPVLMLLAQQPAWTAEYEEFVRELVPDLDYRVLEGVSHFLMLDRPEEFNAAVVEFVRKKKLLRKSER